MYTSTQYFCFKLIATDSLVQHPKTAFGRPSFGTNNYIIRPKTYWREKDLFQICIIIIIYEVCMYV